MNFQSTIFSILLSGSIACVQIANVATAQESADRLSLEQVRAAGTLESIYRRQTPPEKDYEKPQANLKTFRAEIEPALRKACYKCHGAEKAEGDFRVDTLNPDLLHGDDVNWWLEVSSAVGNG